MASFAGPSEAVVLCRASPSLARWLGPARWLCVLGRTSSALAHFLGGLRALYRGAPSKNLLRCRAQGAASRGATRAITLAEDTRGEAPSGSPPAPETEPLPGAGAALARTLYYGSRPSRRASSLHGSCRRATSARPAEPREGRWLSTLGSPVKIRHGAAAVTPSIRTSSKPPACVLGRRPAYGKGSRKTCL